jgi:hypothetical protein
MQKPAGNRFGLRGLPNRTLVDESMRFIKFFKFIKKNTFEIFYS